MANEWQSQIASWFRELDKVISGYERIKRQVVVAVLADGHVLLEAVPGTAKTTLVKTIQKAVGGSVQRRIQFTPDKKPSDIIGGEVFNPQTGLWEVRTGPVIGCNFLLADELNRTTPKTLSAMLEAMEERCVTIGGESYDLLDPFLVLGTINPVEQEGTFALPEAQLDRFCFKLIMTYVSRQDEITMLGNTQVHGVDSGNKLSCR